MYRCLECGSKFEEPDYMEVCWEAYYGVGHDFARRNYGAIAECPHCGSSDIEEVSEEDDDDFEE